jgi:glycosyltransferase involved in cell wall biosynthesis
MEQFQKGLVSIIIPSFNREALLPETLDSILAQTYTEWECIIVDDGSIDSSLNIAEKYAVNDDRFRVCRRPWYKKKGANNCRNYGFSKISGEFVQWFDSDDIMLPSMIDAKVSKIIFDKSDIVIARLGFFKNKIDDFYTDDRINIESESNNLPFDFFAGNFWFQTSQPLFRKSFLSKQKQLFNLNLKRNQETEFFVRLLTKNPKISYINNVLILQRIHSDSISGFYDSLSESKKYIINLPAYKLLYISFLNTPFLTEEVSLYFKKFFESCLKKMNFNLFSMINLLYFGTKYNLFSSNIIALKYFIFRFINIFK